MISVEHLPDCYRKDPDSNNYKLLELGRQGMETLREDIGTVMAALDINQASGKTLDLYGDMLQQRRGQLNDEQYRYMLLARIGRNTVQGDYNSIMTTAVLMLSSHPGAITMNDFELEEGERPCEVRLTKFPVQVLLNAGFSSRQAVAMIESLLPLCVTLSADNFDGTFEFADTDRNYDAAAGFGDIAQTVGGYLGLYLGDDDKIPVLPL